MATVSRKVEARRARPARPTGEKFDAQKAFDYTMSRYPNVMARLAE